MFLGYETYNFLNFELVQETFFISVSIGWGSIAFGDVILSIPNLKRIDIRYILLSLLVPTPIRKSKRGIKIFFSLISIVNNMQGSNGWTGSSSPTERSTRCSTQRKTKFSVNQTASCTYSAGKYYLYLNKMLYLEKNKVFC